MNARPNKAFSGLFLILPLACGDSHQEQSSRPNVLVIYCDDLRFDGAAALGSSFLSTPGIDRLADEGVTFERSYTTTSRCCPSRATFLTGVRASTHGVWVNRPSVDWQAGRPLLAEVLQEGGYRTAWVGKWHLPNPGALPVRGFDHFASYEGPGSHFDQTFVVNGQSRGTGGFQADVINDLALEFIDGEVAVESQPWFLVLGHKAPHVPLTPAPEFVDALEDIDLPLPASMDDPLSSLPARYQSSRVGEGGRHGIAERLEWYQEVRAYWELVLSLDASIGRLLESLEARHLLQDTLVILTSDNGQLLGEHGLQQKGLGYEPSIRVPLILRDGPWGHRGVRKGLVTNLDLAPTILERVGLPIPAEFEGRSFVDQLRDPEARGQERFLYQAPAFGGDTGVVERGVIEAEWKYLVFEAPGTRQEALFNLVSDPDERRDLAQDPAHQLVRDRLATWLVAERSRIAKR
jgi:N-acetylglucosamine-6-sulfatase